MKVGGAHVVFHRFLKTSKNHAVCAVLLCKRTQDAPMHPGYWGLFGGKVNAGERPRDAALREVKEELGIAPSKISVKSLCDVRVGRGNSGALAVRYFSAPLKLEMDQLSLRRNSEEDKVEGDGIGWFTAEEIHHLMVRPEDRIAISTFFKRYGS